MQKEERTKHLPFWKSTNQPVPGRPQQKDKNSESFTAYQVSVSDAWEVVDDHYSMSKSPSRTAQNAIIAPHNFANGKRKIRLEKYFKIPGSPAPFSTDQNDPKSAKFKSFLLQPRSLEELKKLSWSGIPSSLRAVTWQLLSSYLPLEADSREEELNKKRKNYWMLVRQYYESHLEITYKDTYHQIHIDVPRMNANIALFQEKMVHKMFERILFVWAMKHSPSGYVQGMNDLVTPFFIVFLRDFIPPHEDFRRFNIDKLSAEERAVLEADTFWCLSHFMNRVQDNYVYAQKGIQKYMDQLKDLIQRVDLTLHKHLVDNHVDYLQFSFRWFNNLLTRELPIECIIRLWDTYLAEGDSFPVFILFVCGAFLLHWREMLLTKTDFQSLMMYLQNLPTDNWNESDVCLIVAEAYRLKVMFADAPKHLECNV